MPRTSSPSGRHLLRATGSWAPTALFMLALASGIPFNGMFLYVLSAPGVPRRAAASGAGQFFWFFSLLTIAGIMAGLALRSAGRAHRAEAPDPPRLRDDAAGLAANVTLNLLFGAPRRLGAAADRGVRLRLGADGAGRHADGARPAPDRRGMASSLQACIGSTNGIVAGAMRRCDVIPRWRWRSPRWLMMSIGPVAWCGSSRA